MLDYYPGKDLSFYLDQSGKFEEELSRKYLVEILLALEELHKNDIIYRDLKPENIMLDCTGHAVLIDFGLSKQRVSKFDKGAHSFCGSVAYLAPEMIKK